MGAAPGGFGSRVGIDAPGHSPCDGGPDESARAHYKGAAQLHRAGGENTPETARGFPVGAAACIGAYIGDEADKPPQPGGSTQGYTHRPGQAGEGGHGQQQQVSCAHHQVQCPGEEDQVYRFGVGCLQYGGYRQECEDRHGPAPQGGVFCCVGAA